MLVNALQIFWSKGTMQGLHELHNVSDAKLSTGEEEMPKIGPIRRPSLQSLGHWGEERGLLSGQLKAKFRVPGRKCHLA